MLIRYHAHFSGHYDWIRFSHAWTFIGLLFAYFVLKYPIPYGVSCPNSLFTAFLRELPLNQHIYDYLIVFRHPPLHSISSKGCRVQLWRNMTYSKEGNNVWLILQPCPHEVPVQASSNYLWYATAVTNCQRSARYCHRPHSRMGRKHWLRTAPCRSSSCHLAGVYWTWLRLVSPLMRPALSGVSHTARVQVNY